MCVCFYISSSHSSVFCNPRALCTHEYVFILDALCVFRLINNEFGEIVQNWREHQRNIIHTQYPMKRTTFLSLSALLFFIIFCFSSFALFFLEIFLHYVPDSIRQCAKNPLTTKRNLFFHHNEKYNKHTHWIFRPNRVSFKMQIEKISRGSFVSACTLILSVFTFAVACKHTAAVWLQGNKCPNDIYFQHENDKAHCPCI